MTTISSNYIHLRLSYINIILIFFWRKEVSVAHMQLFPSEEKMISLHFTSKLHGKSLIIGPSFHEHDINHLHEAKSSKK
jgi:hypothetical protein